MNSEWQEITFVDLCNNYKDNWIIEYKFPEVDIWIDYDIKKSTLVSFIVLNQMNTLWRYRILNIH